MATRQVKITVDLSQRAYGVLCGLVQPTDVVNPDGITAPDEVWTEIREAFDHDSFMTAVKAGLVDYDEDAGL